MSSILISSARVLFHRPTKYVCAALDKTEKKDIATQIVRSKERARFSTEDWSEEETWFRRCGARYVG
jgi:hypothetical protein